MTLTTTSLDLSLESLLSSWQERANHALRVWLRRTTNPPCPAALRDAIHYVCLDVPAKRLRPALVYATAQALGAHDLAPYDHLANALELIHTYTLVHDDLPAIDNDTVRRGQPSCHAAFDEMTAILVGDACQTLAFQSLSEAPIPPQALSPLLQELCHSIGPKQLIGGQYLDCTHPREGDNLLQRTMWVHQTKTGALYEACIRCTILVHGQAFPAMHQAMLTFGQHFGRTYQLWDDLHDHDTDLANVQEASLPRLIGWEQAYQRWQLGCDEAEQLVAPWPDAHACFAPFINLMRQNSPPYSTPG